MFKIASQISAIETFLPQKVLTNDDLAKMVETSDEWIKSRTGIERRHILVPSERSVDMAYHASIKTLKAAGLSAEDVDCIIVSTISADDKSPAMAVALQGMIGAVNAFAFDIQAACSGFLYALQVADSFIKSKVAKRILLVSSDAMSRLVDWQDRRTCVLMGDGAGACIVSPAEPQKRGIVDIKLYSDGTKYDHIVVHHSEKNGHRGHMTMNGPEVFKQAIKGMGGAMKDILSANNMTIDDIDWIVPHQANARIISALCDHEDFPMGKAIVSIQEHANTSSATIPLAIRYGMDAGKIKLGDTLLLSAFGAGLVWGAAIIRV